MNCSLDSLRSTHSTLNCYSVFRKIKVALCSAVDVLILNGHSCCLANGTQDSLNVFVLDVLTQIVNVFGDRLTAGLGYIKDVNLFESNVSMFSLDLFLFLRAVSVVHLISVCVFNSFFCNFL